MLAIFKMRYIAFFYRIFAPKTVRLFIFLLCSCLMGNLCTAQTVSVGALLGMSNYSGDLMPSYWEMSEIRPVLGINATLGINRYLSVRATLVYAQVAGSDENATNPFTRLRNLHFRSPITEGTVQIVVDFLGNHRRLIPYLYGGIGVFRFSPHAQYNGEWVALQPLGTEGQGLDMQHPRLYRLWATTLPVGGGLRYAINERWQVGLEAGYRLTTTDYLDDVSTDYYDNNLLRELRGDMTADLADRSDEYIADTPPFTATAERGNPRSKDGYLWLGFTAQYQISQSQRGEKYKCFSF